MRIEPNDFIKTPNIYFLLFFSFLPFFFNFFIDTLLYKNPSSDSNHFLQAQFHDLTNPTMN